MSGYCKIQSSVYSGEGEARGVKRHMGPSLRYSDVSLLPVQKAISEPPEEYTNTVRRIQPAMFSLRAHHENPLCDCWAIRVNAQHFANAST